MGEWRPPVSNVYQPVQWKQIQQPAPEVLKLPRVRMASKMRILFNHNLFKISVKCFQITTVIFPGVPQSHQGARDATKLVPSGTGGEVDTITENKEISSTHLVVHLISDMTNVLSQLY